jgi:biotin carboxyl carrier protein
VGAQAVENVVSGKRYEQITDEVIKYILGYYGEPVAPIDPNIKDKILNLPRTKAFIDWQPKGYLKSVEEFRQEVGPELSDDELLLKVIIPGGPVKRKEQKPDSVKRPTEDKTPPTSRLDGPMAFRVDVDGEVFNVKVSPIQVEYDHEMHTETTKERPKKPKTVSQGTVLSKMAGTVVSIKVNVEDRVKQGDLLATIEAMKMMRDVLSPHAGVVREVCVFEGEMVEPEDILMVVEPGDG